MASAMAPRSSSGSVPAFWRASGPPGGPADGAAAAARRQLDGRGGRVEHVGRLEHQTAADDVLELADVARPVVQSSMAAAPGEMAVTHARGRSACFFRKCSASSGTSSRRSRSGGTSIGKTGSYEQHETNLNFDVVGPVGDRLHVAAGAEHRTERFAIPARRGRLVAHRSLRRSGLLVRIERIQRLDTTAGQWGRSSAAVYGDVELYGAATDPWTLGGALRYEHFDDFGPTLKREGDGALPAGTGRRGKSRGVDGASGAPTPGQQNTFNITTAFIDGELTNNRVVPSTSRVALHRGGRPLQPETSTNYSAGLVVEAATTADYFPDRHRRPARAAASSSPVFLWKSWFPTNHEALCAPVSRGSGPGRISPRFPASATSPPFSTVSSGPTTDFQAVIIVRSMSRAFANGLLQYLIMFACGRYRRFSSTWVRPSGAPPVAAAGRRARRLAPRREPWALVGG